MAGQAEGQSGDCAGSRSGGLRGRAVRQLIAASGAPAARGILTSLAGFAAFAVHGAAVPQSAAAQEITVAGVVVEVNRGATVGDVALRLSGGAPVFTNLDGSFRFEGVAPGSYTLTVEAYGYRQRTLPLDLHADTTLRIELEPDPVMLDTLAVDLHDVTIRGSVEDAETGRRVLIAQVIVRPGPRTVGANSGNFTIEDVPAGQQTTLTVEAMEYLPAHIALIPRSDTTLTVELEVDSVALRMVQQQVQRLHRRAQSSPYSLKTMNRDDIRRSHAWNALEVVRKLAPGKMPRTSRQIWGRRSCFFLDDFEVTLDRLQGLPPEQIERVEVYGSGPKMIRVYTRRFVHRLMRKGTLAATGHITGLGSATCF